MKTTFKSYLEEIELSKTIINRIDELINLYEKHIPEQIIDIFVENIYTEDGNNIYPGLIFFSDNFYMEIPGFIKNNAIGIFPLKNKITAIQLSPENYSFDKCTGNSRLSVEFTLGLGLSVKLHSSFKNCNHLKNRLDKYIIKNIKLVDNFD